MQATQAATSPYAARPKVGRPPAAITLVASIPVEEPAAEKPAHRPRSLGKLALALGLALVASITVAGLLTPDAGHIPGVLPGETLLAHAQDTQIDARNDNARIVGNLALMAPRAGAEVYGGNPDSAVDKGERQRLLTILSKE